MGIAAWSQRLMAASVSGVATGALLIRDYRAVGKQRPAPGPLAPDARARVAALLAGVDQAHLFSIFPPETDFYTVGRVVESAAQRNTSDRDVGSKLYLTRVQSSASLQAVSMNGAVAARARAAAGIAVPVVPPPVVPPPVAAAGVKRDAVHRTPPRPISKR